MDDAELKARFGKIADRLLPHVGLLPSRKAQPKDVLYNGTASFIDTGTEKLLVTCGHVIDRYQQLKATSPEAVLAITGNSGTQPVVVSDAQVIDNGGTQMDLATMRLPDPDRITWGGKSYFKAETWPPVRGQKGQVAVLAGFPGMHREQSSRGLEVRATPICDFVTSISDRNIYLVDEDLAHVAVKHNPALKDLASLGGMSGSTSMSWTRCVRLAGIMSMPFHHELGVIHAEDDSYGFGQIPNNCQLHATGDPTRQIQSPNNISARGRPCHSKAHGRGSCFCQCSTRSDGLAGCEASPHEAMQELVFKFEEVLRANGIKIQKGSEASVARINATRHP